MSFDTSWFIPTDEPIRQHATIPATYPKGTGKYGPYRLGQVITYPDTMSREEIEQEEKGFAAWIGRYNTHRMREYPSDIVTKNTGLVLDLGPNYAAAEITDGVRREYRYWCILGYQGYAPVYKDGSLGRIHARLPMGEPDADIRAKFDQWKWEGEMYERRLKNAVPLDIHNAMEREK